MSGISEITKRELAKEQQLLVSSTLEDWNKTQLTTEGVNREEAEKEIVECYLLAGLKKPKVIWAMSPLGGLLTSIITVTHSCAKQNIWSKFNDNAHEIISMGLWYSRKGNISKRGEVSPETLIKFIKNHSSYIELQQKTSFWDQIFNDVLNSIGSGSSERRQLHSHDSLFPEKFNHHSGPNNISNAIWKGVFENLPMSLKGKDKNQSFEKGWLKYSEPFFQGEYHDRCGYFNAANFAIYDALNRIFHFEFLKPLLGLIRVARPGIWWWPFDGIVVVSERPIFLNFDENGRLHCENDMAIKYQDGWGVYAWHGIRVPENIIKTPNQITLRELESESNIEIRRIMLERYGWERYLKDSSEPIHEDDYGVLYKRQMSNDEPLVIVKVKNRTPESDGSFKSYFLRVPPWVRTAHQAVAWTFNMNKEEYTLEKET